MSDTPTEYTFGNWRATHVFDEGTESQHVATFTMPDGTTRAMTSFAHPTQWVWDVRIKASDTGNYIWCDCAYGCEHCGRCIGCARKLVFDWDTHEFDEDEARCSVSPTGWHEVKENDEE